MAYMNQEKKAKIKAAVDPILKKYGMKGSLSVQNHSSVTLTLKSGPIDFGKTYEDINQYHYQRHYEDMPEVVALLDELVPAMMAADWFDKSDIQSDYFNTAYYYHIVVGKWNKPYELVA